MKLMNIIVYENNRTYHSFRLWRGRSTHLDSGICQKSISKIPPSHSYHTTKFTPPLSATQIWHKNTIFRRRRQSPKFDKEQNNSSNKSLAHSFITHKLFIILFKWHSVQQLHSNLTLLKRPCAK